MVTLLRYRNDEIDYARINPDYGRISVAGPKDFGIALMQTRTVTSLHGPNQPGTDGPGAHRAPDNPLADSTLDAAVICFGGTSK